MCCETTVLYRVSLVHEFISFYIDGYSLFPFLFFPLPPARITARSVHAKTACAIAGTMAQSAFLSALSGRQLCVRVM